MAISLPIGADQAKRDISRISMRPLRLLDMGPLLNYSIIERMYSNGWLLGKSRPIGTGRGKRDTSGILQRSLKFLELIPMLNYSVIGDMYS